MPKTTLQKILIIAPAWVGDMVMAQSLFRYLRQQHPHLMIDVVAPASTLALLQFMPEVRRAIKLPLKHGEFGFITRLTLSWKLRHKRYQQAIVLTNSWKSALITFFLGAKTCTGFLGELRYGLLSDARKLDKKALPLMIQRFLSLGFDKKTKYPEWFTQLPDSLAFPKKQKLTVEQQALMPKFSVSENDQQAILKKLNLQRDKKIIAICPGAAFGPSKRWPPEYFAELAKQQIHAGKQVWIFGAPSDQEAAETIQRLSDNQAVNLTGKTNLLEAIALLSLTDTVLTNDSGLMHIACALQKKVIAIYGSSSPNFTPPLSDNVDIHYLNMECSPCFERECPLKHWRCMRDLRPDQIKVSDD